MTLKRWLSPLSRAFGRLGRAPRTSEQRDVQRAAAERVLEHYRTLLIDLGAVVWELDLEAQQVTAVSDSCATVLGYSAQQWRESPRLWIDTQHPDDLERSMALIARLAGGAGEEVYEHRMIAPDGHVVWLHTAIRAARDAAGHAMLRGVSMDITAHKRIGTELQGALSLVQATLDATDNGILVVGLDDRITSHNQKFAQMWGIMEGLMGAFDEDAARRHASAQVKDPERFVARIREIYCEPGSQSFDVIEFRDGRVIERTSQPQRLGGAIVGRVWSFRDVTERLRTEQALRLSNEQLQQAQKMEAVGQLAGGVAHDFNNILTAVLGNLSLILADPEVPLGVRHRAEEIQLASERAANLTRQLLAFGRRQILTPRIEYLCVVLLEMVKLLRLSAGERITIELDLAPEPSPVLIERGQMEQVILNLVINARDAMPAGGRIVIKTRRVERAAAGSLAWTESAQGHDVLLSVRDDGEGMDAATMARAFEPFFTTKDRGRGTGLGLASAYGIVQQLGGSIQVHSARGQGATFDILVPHAPQGEGHGAGRAPARLETVMVVEDEPPLRGLMRDALAGVGYRVIEVPNGHDALELCEALPGGLDVLVSDILMAGIDGVELAARLRAQRPGVRVLFITGLGADAPGLPRELPADASVLRKPFTMEALLRRVRECFERE